jgi:hypothetical protein
MTSELWDATTKAHLSVKYPDGSYAPVPVPPGMTPREYVAAIEGLGDGYRVTGVTVTDAEGVQRSVAR